MHLHLLFVTSLVVLSFVLFISPPVTTIHNTNIQTGVAAVTKAVQQKGTCRLGDLNIYKPTSVGEQDCLRGAEYEIFEPLLEGNPLKIRTIKCPKPPPPSPPGVNAEVWKKQWEAQQPEGIVRLKEIGGTTTLLCNEKLSSSSWLMQKINTTPSPSSVTQLTQQKKSLIDAGYPLLQTTDKNNEIFYTLMTDPADTPSYLLEQNYKILPSKPLEDLTQEIEEKRNELIDKDPRIQRAAQDSFRLEYRLKFEEPQYLEANPDDTHNTLRASIEKDMHAALVDNTRNAIENTFENAPEYSADTQQNQNVTRVFNRETNNEIFYNNLTGKPFMNTRDSSLFLVSPDGTTYQVGQNPNGEWKDTLGTLDKSEYTAFVDRYFSPKGYQIGSIRYEPPTGEMEDYWNSHITITDIKGNVTAISAHDYQAVLNAGKRVYETDMLADEMRWWTHGKMTLQPPDEFPLTSSGLFKPEWASAGVPKVSSLTPLSIERYADTMEKMAEVYKQLPREFWENADMIPTTVYNFGEDPAKPKGRITGTANLGGGNTWTNPDTSYGVFQTTAHELQHTLGYAFPTDTEWGETAYGKGWQRAYGGATAAEALAAKTYEYQRPLSYASQYGIKNPLEDKAEVFAGMMINYTAMRDEAREDEILTKKMKLIQDAFFTQTQGVMDQHYWNTMKVLDPNYFHGYANPKYTNRMQLLKKGP